MELEIHPIGILYNKSVFTAAGITETPETFAEFMQAQDKVNATYLDKERWNRMSLVNIAKAGFFAADRAVEEYPKRIGGLKPIK